MEIPTNPGIYLINIGKVNDLKETFNFDKEYDDDYYVYKFGLSKNINDRFETHKRNFTKLNCDIKFEYYVELSHKNLDFYENLVKKMLIKNDICKEFVKNNCNNICYEELFVININDITFIKNFYDKLNEFKAPEKLIRNNIQTFYKCKYCNEEFLKEFYETKHCCCKNCKNKMMEENNFFVVNDKTYLCKHCGEKDIEKFYSNRFSACIKCKTTRLKTREEMLSKIILDKRTELLIEKYICSYQELFNNRSIKDILQILEDKNNFLQFENKEIKIENLVLKEKFTQLEEKLNKFLQASK